MSTDTISDFVATAKAHPKPAAALFRTVRDMPYATNAAHNARQLLEIRRGDCLAKSELLAQALTSLNYDIRFVRWKYRLPSLPGVSPFPVSFDLHRAIEVWVQDSWRLVDPTHDPALSPYLTVSDWDGRGATEPAYTPIGPVMLEAGDQEAIDLISAEIDEAMQPLDSETVDGYRASFNAALDAIRLPRMQEQ